MAFFKILPVSKLVQVLLSEMRMFQCHSVSAVDVLNPFPGFSQAAFLTCPLPTDALLKSIEHREAPIQHR